MALTPGSRIGSYEIHGLLGEGGMGQVYKAHDSRLGRDVAIKVLPASVANDPDRLARFEREAKVLASLSHTNIAQIYGLEDAAVASGQVGRVLVMELAPGQDLTIRLNQGPMPLHDALPIALQITHGLEAAHDAGIVHRDLKPANIKVSDDGAVKVLDFGLAKAFAPGDASSASAMNSPTLTAHATAAGVILGTAAYMSPEQARGRDADKRADVWSFGVVFFEMLTGARLFQGETISDTLAAVLRQDMPWALLPRDTPSEITKLLRRCLERDRKNRLHDIADARIVLEEVARTGGREATPAVATVAAPRKTPWLWFGIAAAAALVAGILIGKAMTPAAPAGNSSSLVRFNITLPRGVAEVADPAIAPDGSFVVFRGTSAAGADALYIQRLNEVAPKLIERSENARLPFISFDGRWIAFRRGNKLHRIALDGGEPLPITDIPSNSPGGIWLQNNTILFPKSWLSPMFVVPIDGGEPRQVSTLDTAKGEIGHWFPSTLPDSDHVLMTVWKKAAGINDAEIAVLDLKTGRHEILFKGAEGRYVASGFIMFFRAGAYHAVRFDPSTRKFSGEPVRVVDDAYGNSSEGDVPQTDLSANGTLAYLTGPNTLPRELTWIAADGKATTLGFPARAYNSASISQDGHRLAVGLVESGRNLIRLIDLDSGKEEPLDLPGASWRPRWHPDGKRLAYRSMQKGDFDIYWKDVTSGGGPERLLVSDFDESPEAFMTDGKSLIVEQSNTNGNYLPALMPLTPIGPPKPFIADTTEGIAVSAKGSWIAYVSDRRGGSHAYVVAPDGGGVPERISTGSAQAVAWSRDGAELFYLREPEIVKVSFRTDGNRFHATGERVWAKLEGSYATGVMETGADGRVLVAVAKDPPPRLIRVVVNWAAEVAGKVK